jgi:hypothetical protein
MLPQRTVAVPVAVHRGPFSSIDERFDLIHLPLGLFMVSDDEPIPEGVRVDRAESTEPRSCRRRTGSGE